MTVTLRDGAQVDVRPVEPEDRAALAEGFERLSPESRYRRFFGPMPRLSDRDLDYLTRVDHHDHEALVAVDALTGDGIGVARYVRDGRPTSPSRPSWSPTTGRGAASAGCCSTRWPERADARRACAASTRPSSRRTSRPSRCSSGWGGRRAARTGARCSSSIELPAGSSPGAGGGALLRSSRRHAPARPDPARRPVAAPPRRARRAPAQPHRRGDRRVRARDRGAADGRRAGAAVGRGDRRRRGPPLPAHRPGRARRGAPHGGAGLRERGLDVHERLGRGDPALVLADVAADEDARLIVVGAGERGKTARRLIGSVADSVAQRASCDVLIVRPREPAEPSAAPDLRRRRRPRPTLQP